MTYGQWRPGPIADVVMGVAAALWSPAALSRDRLPRLLVSHEGDVAQLRTSVEVDPAPRRAAHEDDTARPRTPPEVDDTRLFQHDDVRPPRAARAISTAQLAVRVLSRTPICRRWWRNTCLYRATAECIILRWTGHRARLRLGVRDGAGPHPVAAHAWVECRGTSSAAAGRYIPLEPTSR